MDTIIDVGRLELERTKASRVPRGDEAGGRDPVHADLVDEEQGAAADRERAHRPDRRP